LRPDPAGLRTTYGYDGLDRLTQVIANAGGSLTPANVTTHYGYDRQARLTSSTDALSHTHGRTYDAAGRQTSSTDGLTRAPNYTYDRGGRRLTASAGRPATLTRNAAAGTATVYSYDGADRLIGLTTSTGASVRQSYSYTLTRGSLVSAVREVRATPRTINYAYDGLTRVITATESPGTVYGYSYDLVGNRTAVRTNGSTTESRTYDAADQISTHGWSYDAAGELVGDGTNTYSYDALRRHQDLVCAGLGAGVEPRERGHHQRLVQQ